MSTTRRRSVNVRNKLVWSSAATGYRVRKFTILTDFVKLTV